MAISNASRPRAPRGTKILSQAFFAALSDIPEPQQEAVAKAALVAIKEQLALRRQKAKLVSARTRAKRKVRTEKRQVASSGRRLSHRPSIRRSASPCGWRRDWPA